MVRLNYEDKKLIKLTLGPLLSRKGKKCNKETHIVNYLEDAPQKTFLTSSNTCQLNEEIFVGLHRMATMVHDIFYTSIMLQVLLKSMKYEHLNIY